MPTSWKLVSVSLEIIQVPLIAVCPVTPLIVTCWPSVSPTVVPALIVIGWLMGLLMVVILVLGTLKSSVYGTLPALGTQLPPLEPALLPKLPTSWKLVALTFSMVQM